MIALSFSRWSSLHQADLDWLISERVAITSMIRPCPILSATGTKGHDGRFEQTTAGPRWLVFEEAEDEVFWNPATGELATSDGRAFALGEDAVGNAATYSFDCALTIHADPLAWLRDGRKFGCVVLDWSRAFDQLRDRPRVAVAESLLHQYRRAMKPPRLPETFVIPARRIAA